MREEYKILKLDNNEIAILKNILAKAVVDNMFEKNAPDYEEKVKKDYAKYSQKQKEAVACEKILNILNYLER